MLDTPRSSLDPRAAAAPLGAHVLPYTYALPACPTGTPVVEAAPGYTTAGVRTTNLYSVTIPPNPVQLSSQWTYSLKFDLPSRLATMKNVLGDSVSIITSYQPPDFGCELPVDGEGFLTCNVRTRFSGQWANASNIVKFKPIIANKYVDGSPAVDNRTQPPFNLTCDSSDVTTWQNCNEWIFKIQFRDGGGTAIAQNDPGTPFDPFYDVDAAKRAANAAAGKPGIGVGTAPVTQPKNVIGNNAARVNWGLLVYGAFVNEGTCETTNTQNVRRLVPIDTNDGTSSATFMQYLRLARDGGLTTGGGTNTRQALDKAQEELVDTFARDEKYLCKRTYGVILVSDGLSNTCNSDNEGDYAGGLQGWSTCSTDVTDSDPASSAATNYQNFPPAMSEAIYGLDLVTSCTPDRNLVRSEPIKPRTWFIAADKQLPRCEPNYTAFKGRTDAVNSDDKTGLSEEDSYWASFNPVNDYAFFAESSEQLTTAFGKIIAATADGDYATSQPVSGAALGTGNIVLLASTKYPDWEGQLYAFDTTKLVTDPDYELWNAATRLKTMDLTKRRIYTWDPANNNDLVEVKLDAGGNLPGALAAIEPTLTDRIVDFIRGYDGTKTGTKRDAILGPLVNTTPAVTGRPTQYKRNRLESHLLFEQTYANRRPLVYVGSTSGLLHAFDFETGDEAFALIPPSLLARQAALYANYLADESETGQPGGLDAHIWGVTNSLRYGDVFYPGGGGLSAGYRTLALLSLGPGGNEVYGIDITHPYPGVEDDDDTPANEFIAEDVNYGIFDTVDTNAPVKILFSMKGGDGTGGTVNGLRESWSVPALSAVSTTNWKVLMGGGWDAASQKGSQIDPSVLMFDPTDPTTIGRFAPSSLGSGELVGNQAFADSTLYMSNAAGFASDNESDMGLQPDLNGRIHYVKPTDITTRGTLIDATTKIGATQPIYYPVSASGYGTGPGGCAVYGFASGTLYEKSEEVTGPNTGTTGYFTPYLYIAGQDRSNIYTQVPATNVAPIAIQDLTFDYCETGQECESYPDDKTKAGWVLDQQLSPVAQVTAPGFMLVPAEGTGDILSLYLVYDPTIGCNGRSIAVVWPFQLNSSCGPIPSGGVGSGGTNPDDWPIKTYDAGEGAAAGFTVTGDSLVASKSGIGKDGKAGLYQPKDIQATLSSDEITRPIWWKELK